MIEKIESLQPLLVSEPYLSSIVSPIRLWRFDMTTDRHYYTVDDDRTTYSSFLSVTSFSKKVLPTSSFMIEWKVRNGKEESERLTEEASKYGTFMHIECGQFLKNGKYDFDRLPDVLLSYMTSEFQHGFLYSLYQDWLEKAQNDIASFIQFCYDYKLEVIAMEFPIADFETGLAGCLDLVARIWIEVEDCYGETYKTGSKKGQPKLTKKAQPFVAVIDLKSGRKGFYREHEIQLQTYGLMWNKWFGSICPVTKFFNFAPSDWRGNKATYKLKDQTDSIERECIPHYIAIAKAQGYLDSNKVVRTVIGVCELGKEPTENIKYQTLEDIMLGKNNPTINHY